MSSIDLTVFLISIISVALGFGVISSLCLRNSSESKFLKAVIVMSSVGIGLIGTYFFL